VFSISLFAQSAVPLLARGFYALEDTRTPVAISVVAVALNLALAWTVGRRFGALGLAATFSVAAAVDFLLHLLLLRNRLGSLDDMGTLRSLGRTVTATALGGAGLLATRWLLGQVVLTATFAEVLAVTLGSLLVGGLVYVLVHALLRSVELREVVGLFTSRLRPLAKLRAR
jgi:putative peptidoglycan lipid II flippase